MMTLTNIIALNVLWFACVLGAANGMIWPGVLVLTFIFAINLYHKTLSLVDAKIMAISLLAGLVIDGSLQGTGVLIYQLPYFEYAFIPPVWIMLLWLGFAVTIRTGMRWFLANPLLGGMILFVGAPLSYLSASKLGAVVIVDLWHAMTFLGISWLLYFIAVVQITQSKRYKSNAVV